MGVRMTVPVRTRNRKREDGRPKGTFKRYRFTETKLGFFLKHETPLEYSILESLIPPGIFSYPPIAAIECVANSSLDPSFKKPKFEAYLNEFKEKGICCGRARKMTPEKEKYYARIRKTKMDRFIESNRQRIKNIKQKLQLDCGIG